RRFSRLISTANTASQQQPRSSVGAGYRCGVRASQTLKRQNIQFFPGAFPAPAGGREAPTYRAQGPDLTPYMGQPRFPIPPGPKNATRPLKYKGFYGRSSAIERKSRRSRLVIRIPSARL